jgi:histidinol-phosphatase
MTASPELIDDLAVAQRLADEADRIALERFRALDLVVETKPDLTPVSDADRAVEERMRAILSEERPTDSILGEEFGTTGTGSRCWILDPIDGTQSYVRGVPVWAALIALVDGDRSERDSFLLGVASAPALGTRWWATRDGGAWCSVNGGEPRRLSVSRVAKIDDCVVSYSDVTDRAFDTTGARPGFTALLDQCWRSRAFGDFWSHLLVAEGGVDVAVEPELKPWDMAAFIPIVFEAGGTVTAVDGTSPMSGGSAVSSNGLLHDQVIGLLAAKSD